MEQHHISAFLMLAEELHFGRASQRLFVTQSTLSRTIRALEEELETLLFERNSRSVRLTPAGSALVGPARELRAAHDRTVAAINGNSGGFPGSVTLAFTGPASHRFAARIASLLASRAPRTTLKLVTTSAAHEGLNHLLDHSVDAVLGRWQTVPAGITMTQIAEEGFVVAVPSSHRLAGRESINFTEVASEEFILLPEHPRSLLRERLHELSERLGVFPRTARTAPDSWTALALVSEGLGVTLTFTSVRDSTNFDGVQFLTLNDELEPAWLSLAWLTRYTNAAVTSVLACAKLAAQQAPAHAARD